MEEIKFNIACDSACDCDKYILEKRGIDVIRFEYTDGVNNYIDKMDDNTKDDLYEEMKNGVGYKTSQINEYRYLEFFRSIYKGLPILFISLGSGLSNTINNAISAANELASDGIDVRVVDSKIASLGIALLIDKAYKKQKAGFNIDKTINCLNNTVKFIDTYYFTDTLDYFYKGGRLSKASYVIGSLLNINVILDCMPDGKLRLVSKAYGKNKAKKEIEKKISENVLNASEQTLYISYSCAKEEAILFASKLVSEFGFKNYCLSEFGPIIGSHTGPGLFSVFFEGKIRK